jgi:hypothetical protein
MMAKNFFQIKRLYYLGIKIIFAKTVYGGNFLGHFLMQELCTFLKTTQNCASFDTLCGQFREKNCQLF